MRALVQRRSAIAWAKEAHSLGRGRASSSHLEKYAEHNEVKPSEDQRPAGQHGQHEGRELRHQPPHTVNQTEQEGRHFAVYLFVHTKHSQKAGPFPVARLKIDLPFP